MGYENFGVLVTKIEDVEMANEKRIRFEVRVVESPAGQVIAGIPSGYDLNEMRDTLKALRGADWAAVIQTGTWLSELIFPGPVGELLVRSMDLVKRSRQKLRIRLMMEGMPDTIPWEYALLNVGGGESVETDFLSLMPDISITRYPAATKPLVKENVGEVGQKVRLLVASSNPAGPGKLDLAKELDSIRRAVDNNERITATYLANATQDSLFKHLDDVRLFHFSGHGDFHGTGGDHWGSIKGNGSIALGDPDNAESRINAQQLALQVRRAGVRVAILASCKSGYRDDYNQWSSVAGALLKADVGAVVCMSHDISHSSTQAFVAAFYEALTTGLSIDEAVCYGRLAAVQTSSHDWGVPVLYLRSADGIIFPQYTENSTLEENREKIRLRTKQYAGKILGKLLGADIPRMTKGNLKVVQGVDSVRRKGEVTGLHTQQLDGGAVKVSQDVGFLGEDGNVTGIRLDDM
ncbi:MAG: CHAT domain-containing protein [bacterium]|nr:CHAT domain-containing protein [bacterium]